MLRWLVRRRGGGSPWGLGGKTPPRGALCPSDNRGAAESKAGARARSAACQPSAAMAGWLAGWLAARYSGGLELRRAASKQGVCEHAPARLVGGRGHAEVGCQGAHARLHPLNALAVRLPHRLRHQPIQLVHALQAGGRKASQASGKQGESGTRRTQPAVHTAGSGATEPAGWRPAGQGLHRHRSRRQARDAPAPGTQCADPHAHARHTSPSGSPSPLPLPPPGVPTWS